MQYGVTRCERLNKQQNGDVRNEDEGAYLEPNDSAGNDTRIKIWKLFDGFRPIVTWKMTSLPSCKAKSIMAFSLNPSISPSS